LLRVAQLYDGDLPQLHRLMQACALAVDGRLERWDHGGSSGNLRTGFAYIKWTLLATWRIAGSSRMLRPDGLVDG
jgi:hypothetical protein